MKRRSLLCAVVALILLSWTVLSGCSRSKESIYWLNSIPELEESALALAKRYEREKGVRVRVITPVSGAYETTLTSEMRRFGSPAIFSVNEQTVETWRELMLDLTGTDFARERITQAFDFLDGDGRLLAVGWGDMCLGIAVNPVLLERAGHSLDEIRDYDSLRLVCEDIHARTDLLGFDAFASTDLGEKNAWRVTDVLAGPVYARERSDEESSGDCAESFQMIYELCVANSPTPRSRIAGSGADPLNEFLRGKAVFLPSGSQEYGTLSAAVPEVEMIPCYCGLEGEEEQGLLCHAGEAWAVNADLSPTEQKNALAFLKWLVSDREAAAVLNGPLGIPAFRTGAENSNRFLQTAAEDVSSGRSGASLMVEDGRDPKRFRKDLTEALKLCNTEPTEESWEAVSRILTDKK